MNWDWNWLDLVFGLIVLLSVVSGFAKGFLRIGIGFAAAIAGFLCAAWFYRIAGKPLTPYVDSPWLANVLGFLLVFVGILGAGALISMALARLFHWVGLTWLDRLLGGAFGFVRGTVIAVMIMMVILAFTPKRPPVALLESRIAPYVIEASHLLSSITPFELKEGFRRSYEQVKKIWSNSVKEAPKHLPAETV
ncbi:MAG: CvpA family protein [Bryobacteraceae bacterium]